VDVGPAVAREARQRLEDFAAERLEGVHLVVVSNREPYLHTDPNDPKQWVTPASGLTTALDPVMRICRGTWVAHGSGAGDRAVTDEAGRVDVPPDDPRFTLRRVWLQRDEIDGYYNGFSNQTLWPMCHQVYVRPRFEEEHWQQYVHVNKKFAQAVLAQIEGRRAIVLVQDYHLALLPKMIKKERPDVVLSQFWHIPWANPDALHTCPWERPLLKGLLGNDIIGFHVRHYCNNFLESVTETLEARIDYAESIVFRGGRRTHVRPYAISIDPEAIPPDTGVEVPEIVPLERNGVRFLLGVDRLDYIKGIPEKLRAFDTLLARHPQLRGKVTLAQLATPTRSSVPEYASLENQVKQLAGEVNERYGNEAWKPVVLIDRMLDAPELAALYARSAACVVGSLQDGMNLVAKEFVASRRDNRGVLVLSQFAGALHVMRGALPVHPFDREAYAATLHEALLMSPEEQERRMRRLRATLFESTIYTWAENILREAVQIQRDLP
jgi:trehalose 6-phosphate synthase